eukprot:GHRQ01016266.1.p1 GENE.GHRQ01016266.1~~GHRQ01016266.1.p1  ORF type:complete len:170 (-),score=13.08 GHRQ01016266.1:448-957(-)
MGKPGHHSSQLTKVSYRQRLRPPTNAFSVCSSSLPAMTTSRESSSNTNLTRVDWNARNAPKTPASSASGVTPSYADSPLMASRPSGTLREGSGTTVARLGGAALLLVVFFLFPHSCNEAEGTATAGAVFSTRVTTWSGMLFTVSPEVLAAGGGWPVQAALQAGQRPSAA